MKTLHYGLVLSIFAVSILPLTAQAAAGVDCDGPCSATDATTAAENTPTSGGLSAYGKSVINYRSAINNRTNIGTTMNRLGNRIERAATGKMGVGGARSNFKIDVDMPSFGQVVKGVTENTGGGNTGTTNPSGAQPTRLDDLDQGNQIGNAPEAATPNDMAGVDDAPTDELAPSPTPSDTPRENLSAAAPSSQISGLVATVALEGKDMSQTEMESFLNDAQQRTDLSDADKAYISGLQAELDRTGSTTSIVSKANTDLAALNQQLANTNLTGAAAADVAQKASSLRTAHNLSDPGEVTALQYTVVSAQAAGGDAVAKAILADWSRQMGPEKAYLDSANRQGIIASIASQSGVSATGAEGQYNAIVGWIEARAAEGRSYDEIMGALNTQNAFLTTAQRIE